jgi:hypothetical protein
VVRAAELGSGGGKATAGNEGGGHSGPESGSSVHLQRCQYNQAQYRPQRQVTLNEAGAR